MGYRMIPTTPECFNSPCSGDFRTRIQVSVRLKTRPAFPKSLTYPEASKRSNNRCIETNYR